LTTSNCFHNFNAKGSSQGKIQPVILGGTISAILGSQGSLCVHYCKGDEVYFTTVLCTKQWTVNWPYIGNAVFRIVQNHGERSCIRRFFVGRSPQSPPPGSAPGSSLPENDY